jgi:hypothetical protein
MYPDLYPGSISGYIDAGYFFPYTDSGPHGVWWEGRSRKTSPYGSRQVSDLPGVDDGDT